MDWLICIFVLSAKYMSGRKSILSWPLFVAAGILTVFLGVQEDLMGIVFLGSCDTTICIWCWRKWHEEE